jgi:enamine deaminase RidA (YjgF/YER057c/UK114 family)
MTIRRLAPETRLAGAVVHGDTVYLAGQVADDAGLDAAGQTADILRQIDALLAEAGTDKRHLLSVQIFIADLADFDAMNRAWDAWVDPAHLPARCTVQARLHDPAWRLEITAIAALPAPDAPG